MSSTSPGSSGNSASSTGISVVSVGNGSLKSSVGTSFSAFIASSEGITPNLVSTKDLIIVLVS